MLSLIICPRLLIVDRSSFIVSFMPDLRKDPIVGRWVIVAKSRAKRPHDFQAGETLPTGKFCPGRLPS